MPGSQLDQDGSLWLALLWAAGFKVLIESSAGVTGRCFSTHAHHASRPSRKQVLSQQAMLMQAALCRAPALVRALPAGRAGFRAGRARALAAPRARGQRRERRRRLLLHQLLRLALWLLLARWGALGGPEPWGSAVRDGGHAA